MFHSWSIDKPILWQSLTRRTTNQRAYDMYLQARFDKSLLASQPRFDQARNVLIRSLVAKGEANAALEQLALRQTDRLSMSDAGLVYAHLGRGDDARAEIAGIERMGQQGYGMTYDIAVIRAALRDKKAGCVALRRALTDHSLTLSISTQPNTWRMHPRGAPPTYSDLSETPHALFHLCTRRRYGGLAMCLHLP